MRLCNDTVTLFNARYDRETDRTVYDRTVLTGVSWYETVKSSVGDKELKTANQCIVRIPAGVESGGKSYTPAGAYIGDGDWTLNEGDILVKGASSLIRPTLAEIHKTHKDDAITILGVTDNRRAPNAPHWKVVGS